MKKIALVWTVTAIVILIMIVIQVVIFNKVEDHLVERNYPIKDEYVDMVEKYSDSYGVPEQVIWSVMLVESHFEPDAVSSAKAKGLMQMTDSTFRWLQSKIDDAPETELPPEMLFDPETNIKYGVFYLSMLYERFGEWELVYAAYNAGPTRVSTWLQSEEYAEDGKLVHIPFKETENYVKRVSDAVKMYDEYYYSEETDTEIETEYAEET